MKSILLTTALVALGGAAYAGGHTSIDFSGSATLGYNDDVLGDHDGFYGDLNLDVTLSAELDNGITVTAKADVDELDAEDLAYGGVTLEIASDTAKLVYGDTEHAAKNAWSAVGSMDQDTFRTQDGEPVLRGEFSFGDFETQISYGVDGTNAAEMLGVAVTASLGTVDLALVYQDKNTTLAIDNDDNTTATQDEILGLRVGTTLGGADIALGYAANQTTNENSTGVSSSYSVGPVTVAASYVQESAGDDNWDVSIEYAEGPFSVKANTDESEDWGLEGSYDVGNGLVIYAGVVDAGEDMYVGGAYDLGGGASLSISYADDGDGDEATGDDDIGAQDYQVGTTVEVSFAF